MISCQNIINSNNYDFIKVYSHPCSNQDQIENQLLKEIDNVEIKDNDNSYEIINESEIKINTLYIYLTKKFRTLINSLYEERDKFGMSEGLTFEEFHNSKYCNLCENKNCLYHLFEYVDMSPRTYWENCLTKWIGLSNNHKNIKVRFYESFKSKSEEDCEND